MKLRMKWTEHVAKINAEYWSANLKGKDLGEDLGVDDKIILKWILKK
jgi:hypothetical protein